MLFGKGRDMIVVEVCSLCSMSCKNCYNEERKRESCFVHLELVKKLVHDYLTLYPNSSIYWVGRGEAFIHPQFHDMVNYVTENFKNASQIIHTNTICAKEKLYLIQHNPKITWVISLDGFKDTHEKNRGVGTYQKTLNFALQDLKALQYDNIHISMKVDKYNYIEIEQFNTFLSSLGLKLFITLRDNSITLREIESVVDKEFISDRLVGVDCLYIAPSGVYADVDRVKIIQRGFPKNIKDYL